MTNNQLSENKMGKVIACSNHKGGVGKTTSVVNIGAGLAKLGRKILLVDMDPQANLTQSFGVNKPEYTIYEALKGEHKLMPHYLLMIIWKLLLLLLTFRERKW